MLQCLMHILMLMLVLLSATHSHAELLQPPQRQILEVAAQSMDVLPGERSALIRLLSSIRHEKADSPDTTPACAWPWVSCCLPLTLQPQQGFYLLHRQDGSWTVEGCTLEAGRVAALHMEDMGLSGMLPVHELQALPALKSLSLANNPELTGGGPALMALLNTLHTADLQNTSLTCSGGTAALDAGFAVGSYLPQNASRLVQPESCDAPADRIVHQSKEYSITDGQTLSCAIVTTTFLNQPTDPASAVLRTDPGFWQYRHCTCGTAPARPRFHLSLMASDGPDVYLLSNGSKLGVACRQHGALEQGKARHKGFIGFVIGSVVGGICVLLAVAILYLGIKRLVLGMPGHNKMQTGRRITPPGTGLQGSDNTITLVATDVKGSTELWEWHPEVMNQALLLHDTLMRASIAACGGYEVTTEGDAFLVAWHTPVAAVRWCLMVQQGLLKLAWPEQLLRHPLCMPRPVALPASSSTVSDGAGLTEQQVLFRGLNVRMGAASGVPAQVMPHPTTGRIQYSGLVLRLATAVADMALGGQVLLEPCTFRLLHGSLDMLHVEPDEINSLVEQINAIVMAEVASLGWTQSPALVGTPLEPDSPSRQLAVPNKANAPLVLVHSTSKDETNREGTPASEHQTQVLVSNALSTAMNSFEAIKDSMAHRAASIEVQSLSGPLRNDSDEQAAAEQEQHHGPVSKVIALFERTMNEVHPARHGAASHEARSGVDARTYTDVAQRHSWDFLFPRAPQATVVVAPAGPSTRLSVDSKASPRTCQYSSKPALTPASFTYGGRQQVDRRAYSNADKQTPSSSNLTRLASMPPVSASSLQSSRSTKGSRLSHSVWTASAIVPADTQPALISASTAMGAGSAQLPERVTPASRASHVSGEGIREQSCQHDITLSLAGLMLEPQCSTSNASENDGVRFQGTVDIGSPHVGNWQHVCSAPRQAQRLQLVRPGTETEGRPAGEVAPVGIMQTGDDARTSVRSSGYIPSWPAPSDSSGSRDYLTPFVPAAQATDLQLEPRATAVAQSGSHAARTKCVSFSQSTSGYDYGSINAEAAQAPDTQISSFTSKGHQSLITTQSLRSLDQVISILEEADQPHPDPAQPLGAGSATTYGIFNTEDSKTLEPSLGTLLSHRWSRIKAAMAGSWTSTSATARRMDVMMSTMPATCTPGAHKKGSRQRLSVPGLPAFAKGSGTRADAPRLAFACKTLLSLTNSSARKSHAFNEMLNSQESQPSPSVQRVMIIDMGVHFMKSLGPSGPQDTVHGLQVIQVLPAALSARASHLNSVKSVRTIAPSFFDAPGAQQALQPRAVGAPTDFPPVIMMFISPESLDLVAQHAGQAVYDQAVSLFCAAVRSVLQDFQLYECQEFQGAMMVAAAAASPAIKAALVLQLRLLEVDWPAELLSMQMAREVRDPESGQLLFRGLRAKVGIYSDRPLSIVPHTTTGRADYWGALVNRAARFMAGASGGQILSDARVMNEVLAAWEQEAVLQKDEQQSMSQAFTHRDTRRSGRLARLRTASARQLNSIKSGQTHARCSIDAILDTLGMHSNDTDDGRNAEVSSPAAVLLTSYPAAILRDITSACTCEQICLESQRAVQAVAHGLSGGDAPMRALSRYASSQLHNMPSRKSTLVCFGMMESQVNVLDLGDFELKGLSVPQALVGFELAHLADRSKGSSESSNGGSKAKCVRPGTGLLSKVPVWLPG